MIIKNKSIWKLIVRLRQFCHDRDPVEVGSSTVGTCGFLLIRSCTRLSKCTVNQRGNQTVYHSTVGFRRREGGHINSPLSFKERIVQIGKFSGEWTQSPSRWSQVYSLNKSNMLKKISFSYLLKGSRHDYYLCARVPSADKTTQILIVDRYFLSLNKVNGYKTSNFWQEPGITWSPSTGLDLNPLGYSTPECQRLNAIYRRQEGDEFLRVLLCIKLLRSSP